MVIAAWWTQEFPYNNQICLFVWLLHCEKHQPSSMRFKAITRFIEFVIIAKYQMNAAKKIYAQTTDNIQIYRKVLTFWNLVSFKANGVHLHLHFKKLALLKTSCTWSNLVIVLIGSIVFRRVLSQTVLYVSFYLCSFLHQ